MLKYIIIALIESVNFGIAVCFPAVTLYRNNFFSMAFLIGFPILYLAFAVLDVVKNRKIRYYFFCLVPVAVLFIVSFLIDGMTTARTNPDSSVFCWVILFEFYLTTTRVGLFILISLYRLLLRKRKIKTI